MKTAKLVKDVSMDFQGMAKLYKLTPPIKVEPFYDGGFKGDVEYVVVSTSNVLYTGIETYIFPADKDGNILDWCELEGSERGISSHETVIANAGYEIVL